jgi:hypothetical protein
MPREPLDTPEDLPNQAPRQVALGQLAFGLLAFGLLQDEVPRVPDEASAGLEEPLLEARQRPVLDGRRQGQPTSQIAEVVGDDSQEQGIDEVALDEHAHAEALVQLKRIGNMNNLRRRSPRPWDPST